MSRRSPKDRRRSRDRSRDRHRHRDRDHSRDRSSDRHRDRYKNRDRERDKHSPHHMKAIDYHSSEPTLPLVPTANGNNNHDDSRGNGDLSLDGGERKRKKKSRWAATDKAFIPGMPTLIPANLTKEQEKMYIIQLQIEDLTRRLKTGELGIPPKPEDRSPSPEPIYSTDGKRLNTREYRTRKKLEEDRQNLLKQLMDMNPDYKPPAALQISGGKMTDKVFIPQEDHPHINFVGLLIGPRGNTLKALEKETGAKIIIRGKGSVKDGKVGRTDGQPMPGEDEPLHAYVQAPTPDAVQKAVQKINTIIEEGINVPEGENDLRKAQLRELALLNGTLRETDGLARIRALAETQSIATNNIICSFCGAAGHIASDCKINSGASWYNNQAFGEVANPNERAKMDSEYTALMNELGVKGAKIPTNRLTFEPPPPGTTTASSSATMGETPFGGALEWHDSGAQPLPPGVEKDDLPSAYVSDTSSSLTSASSAPPPKPKDPSTYQPKPSVGQQNVRYAYAMQPPPGGGFADPSMYWNTFPGIEPPGTSPAPPPPPPGINPAVYPSPASSVYPASMATTGYVGAVGGYPPPPGTTQTTGYFPPPPPPPPGL